MYINELNSQKMFCPLLQDHLDSLHTHRLLKLYVHTIIFYGHGFLLWDLMFEAIHQYLMATLSRKASSKSHFKTLHQFLEND